MTVMLALAASAVAGDGKDDGLFNLAVGEYVYAGAADDRHVISGRILIDEARNFDHRAELMGTGGGRFSGFVKWVMPEKGAAKHMDGSELIVFEIDARSGRAMDPGWPVTYLGLMKDGRIHSVGYIDGTATFRAYVRVDSKKKTGVRR